MAEANDDRLRLLVERIERLEEEKKGIADDIRDVYAEAKAVGYDGPQYLHFERYGLDYGFLAAGFRKITPRADEAIRADAEWVADLIGAPQREKIT